VVEGTRGIDFLFGVIIAVVASNWIAQHVHSEGVYESELERDSSVYFLLQEPPHALRPHTAATVSRRTGSAPSYLSEHEASFERGSNNNSSSAMLLLVTVTRLCPSIDDHADGVKDTLARVIWHKLSQCI